MTYKHGIEVMERETSFPSPAATKYGVQVIFGTAPVHLAKEPGKAVNQPVKAASFEEAKEKLGYSDDWERYSLCQSMYASFQLFQINPVIFVNVLDPQKHTTDLMKTEYAVEDHQIVIEEMGVLKDTLTVSAQLGRSYTGTAKAGESKVAERSSELKEETDYIADFDDTGKLVLTLLRTGTAYDVKNLMVSGKALSPEMVTEEDMIGAYEVETGKETGIEVLRQVYPKYGLIPGVLMAPGWSHKPNVGAALQGKCEDICGAFRCTCLLDLDTSQTKTYTDVEKAKNEAGYDESHSVVLWPMVTVGGKRCWYSAVYGAMMSYQTASNQDVPYLYPSNKPLYTDGACLEDGTEVLLDQVQAGVLNGFGVVTAFHDTQWKSYGNNMGCYPGVTDPKDRWIGCRRMFDYVANYFVTEYRSRLDENMNKRLIDDIVNSFNIWGNGLVSSGMCAGLSAEYRSEENTMEDVLAGHLRIRIYFAPYTPAEYIKATMEFDVSALEAGMGQEG